MIKSLVRVGALVFLGLGLFKMITGDPTGAVMIVIGAIMDLQAETMNTNDRLKALENKEKNNATESTQGS